MKVNFFLFAISIAIAVLAAYGFYAANDNETYRWLITIGAGLSMALTLGGTLAFSVEGGSLNVKIVLLLFF